MQQRDRKKKSQAGRDQLKGFGFVGQKMDCHPPGFPVAVCGLKVQAGGLFFKILGCLRPLMLAFALGKINLFVRYQGAA